MKKVLTITIAVFTAFQIYAQGGAGINTTGSTADPSAILDVSSTNAGILIPRMTETQKNAISAPATGLMIYQIDGISGFWYYNGAIWVQAIGPIGPTGADGVTGPTGADGFLHYLGEQMDGGIIFNIYKGDDGLEHGLIVATVEQEIKWQNTITYVNATRTWDGVYNTNLITDSPAKTYVQGQGVGWYLPSIDELNILWQNRFYVNKALNNSGFTLLSKLDKYWSSTEGNISCNCAWTLDFFTGDAYYSSTKTSSFKTRAVRAF